MTHWGGRGRVGANNTGLQNDKSGWTYQLWTGLENKKYFVMFSITLIIFFFK